MRLILFLLPIVFLTGCFDRVPEKTGLEGQPLPSFDLFLVDSSSFFNTREIPAGKPIVLFYFGPNCPYSRAQMETILKDMRRLKDIQFYIFTTSPFSLMKAFYNHYRLSEYKNITMGADYTFYFASYFKVRGVPYTAIYGKDRRLKQAFMGKIYSRQIEATAVN